MSKLINDEFFNSELALVAYANVCDKRIRLKGIFSANSVDEILGNAVTLETERATFFTYPEYCEKITRGATISIEQKGYKILNVSLIDDMAVLSLCPL